LKHIKEFSKCADTYDANSAIQKEVATYLLSKVQTKAKTILDLGCGTGHIIKNLSWKYDVFIGVDNAKGMCQKHPKDKNITLFNENFESNIFQNKISSMAPFDLLISSSSLQWAKDIEKLIKFCSSITNNIAFSIFTCKTFDQIYKLSKQEIFLPDASEVVKIIKKYFDIDYELKTYKLYFDDNLSMFRYIKKSGISGGEKKLNISQTKSLIKNYPHNYLEFEVLYVWKQIG
jgi:malonyl-CoA O-methyltransferase